MMRRFRPATRTMKNSSRFDAKMARKFARSSTGKRRILGQLEHPLVERQPAELAIEVPFGGQFGRALDVERLEVVVEVARRPVGGALVLDEALRGHPLIMPPGANGG